MRRPFRRRRLERWLRRGGARPDGLLGLSPEDGQELLLEARRRLEAGAEGVATLLNLYMGLFGATADAMLCFGVYRQEKGDFFGAMRAYRAAAKLRPRDPFALANLLEAALLQDHWGSVRRALRDIASADRDATSPGLSERIARLIGLARERLGLKDEGGEPTTATEPGSPIYDVEMELSVEEFADVLRRSGLAERRPMSEPQTLNTMLANAGVIVTARVDRKLVGVSRAITDFAYCTYLSDLAVDREFQKRGIGKALIRRTHEEAGLQTTLILLAAPLARSYYPHVGMTAHDSCWILPRTPPSA